jgi:hypothetical protein
MTAAASMTAAVPFEPQVCVVDFHHHNVWPAPLRPAFRLDAEGGLEMLMMIVL